MKQATIWLADLGCQLALSLPGYRPATKMANFVTFGRKMGVKLKDGIPDCDDAVAVTRSPQSLIVCDDRAGSAIRPQPEPQALYTLCTQLTLYTQSFILLKDCFSEVWYAYRGWCA